MSKKPAPSIHARVLGDASIVTGVTTIEPMAEIIFAAALYLVLQRKEPISRRTVQALLWPDASDRVAAHRLRQTLLKLRQLGMPIEISGKGHIGLNGTPVSVDYEEFLATRKFAENGNNDALVMLPAYEPRFSQAYLEWLDSQKAEVNASMTRIMLGIIARHRVKGEWVEVERNATRLLRFQPYNEEATLALAEAYAMRGGKLQAMEILDRYLSEVGNGPTDLRVPATVMRRRIADRMHPRIESSAGQSPLVGRSAEMEQLAALLEKARRKKGQACLVWGDAGVGKSRLLAEFATFASLQGISTQRVQCRPSDTHRPLSAFVDLVPGLRTMRGAIGCSPETFEYLDKLTKHKPTSGITAGDGNSEFVYARVQQALFDLIDAVSDEGCLIILVEDVHWLDSTSAKLLREMVMWASTRPFFFAFTGRDAPDASLSGVADLLSSIHLPPLEPGPSKDVLLGVVRQHGREIDEGYVAWCVNVAEGNPYFLQELANQWVEGADRYGVPISLAAVLNDRIARLTPDALLLLQTCSLLEKNSTLDRIERIVEFDAHRMLKAINELGVSGMIVGDSAERGNKGSDRLLSRHELLSTAAVARLAPPARAYLHRRIGGVLEGEINHERSASILWDCADHWHLAGNVARALQVAKSCAAHLMEMGLPTAAAEAFERSLPYCTTVEERLSILEDLARAYYRANAWVRVREFVAKSRTIRKRLHPAASHHDELELMDIRANWLCAPSKLPIERARTCLNAPHARPDHRVQAGVMTLMLLDLMCQHDAMPATYDLIDRLANDPSVNPTDRLEAAMVYHTLCGSLDVALEATRTLLALEREGGNCGDLCRRLCNAATVFRTAGQFDIAVELLLESDEIAIRHKLPSARGGAVPMLANLALERGDNAAADKWYRDLLNLNLRDQAAAARLNTICIGARLALLENKPSLALKRFPAKLEQVLREPLGQRRVYGLAMLVAIDLAMGHVSRPALNALELTHIISRRNLHQAFAATVLFRALRVDNRAERAQILLDEYIAKYRREIWPIPAHFLEA